MQFDRYYHCPGANASVNRHVWRDAEEDSSLPQQSHLDYPIALANDAIGSRFGVTETPLTVLIDRQGRIGLTHAVIVDRARLEGDIRQLLAEC